MVADLSHPLDLLFRDRWVILDGVHRLLKADLLGLSTIEVRRLPAAMLPLILEMTT
jgi:ParB-like chromosome segregation protein Spo0J